MLKHRNIIEQAFVLPRVVGALFCATMLVLAIFSQQSISVGDSTDKLASVKTQVEHKRQ